MRVWQCGGLLLIERPARETILASLLAIGGNGEEPPTDFLFGVEHGMAGYDARSWTIDDELGASWYRVEGSSLIKVIVRVEHERRSFEHEIALSGLVPADDVARARAHVILDGQRAAAEREATRRSARVAAIPGALADHGRGEAFARAQQLLCDRIARFEDASSERLLRALLELGHLVDVDPDLEDALGSLIWTCRRAAFDETLPSTGESTCDFTRYDSIKGFRGLDARRLADAQALGVELHEIARALLVAADGQELVDARNDAAALAAAAEGAARVAAMMPR